MSARRQTLGRGVGGGEGGVRGVGVVGPAAIWAPADGMFSPPVVLGDRESMCSAQRPAQLGLQGRDCY